MRCPTSCTSCRPKALRDAERRAPADAIEPYRQGLGTDPRHHAETLLPFDEPAFIASSVAPSSHGEAWCQRNYDAVARLAQPPRVMEDQLGPSDSGISPFERCNLWLLYTALAWGPQRVRFIALWDGGEQGGTRQMMDQVKRHTGRVSWIDMRAL